MIEEFTTRQRPDRRGRISLVDMAEEAAPGTVPVHRTNDGVPHRTSLDDRHELLLYRLSSARIDPTDAMRFNREMWLSVNDRDDD